MYWEIPALSDCDNRLISTHNFRLIVRFISCRFLFQKPCDKQRSFSFFSFFENIDFPENSEIRKNPNNLKKSDGYSHGVTKSYNNYYNPNYQNIIHCSKCRKQQLKRFPQNIPKKIKNMFSYVFIKIKISLKTNLYSSPFG